MPKRIVHSIEYLTPDWPAPAQVKAVSTMRRGGVSEAPFDSLNLSTRVGDDPDHVKANRERVIDTLGVPGAPLWLNQMHGNTLIKATGTRIDDDADPEADASWTDKPDRVCALLTADCLPLLLCDRQARWVAALHCGWRGLAGGIIESALEQLPGPKAQILAWMGPAIGPDAFEVGGEVRNAFLDSERASVDAFRPGESDDRFHADMYSIARFQLEKLDIGHIFGGDFCTVTDEHRFFSFRREKKTGRIATLIWFSG